MRRNLKKLIGLVAVTGCLCLTSITSLATNYTVTPVEAVLYTGKGAELFAEPEPTTVMSVLPGDAPIQVTGMTSNGYFQVVIDGNINYIYGNALSVKKGTYAQTLTYVNAKAAIAVDGDTGNIIYEKNSLDMLAPASTTKIMTALLTLEAVARGDISLDTQVIVSNTALKGLPSDASHVTPRLKAGEVLNILELLECVMIKSDCHACNVLAEAVAGSVDNFVLLMNARAGMLGCTQTNFVNTSGYPAKNHYTNAYSLFLIAKEAMKYDIFRTIVGMKKIVIPATNLTRERVEENTNLLMLNSKYYNPAVIGIKTGYTKAAGHCLVTCAVKDGKTIYTVVLGANSGTMCNGTSLKGQFEETNKLLQIAFVSN